MLAIVLMFLSLTVFAAVASVESSSIYVVERIFSGAVPQHSLGLAAGITVFQHRVSVYHVQLSELVVLDPFNLHDPISIGLVKAERPKNKTRKSAVRGTATESAAKW